MLFRPYNSSSRGAGASTSYNAYTPQITVRPQNNESDSGLFDLGTILEPLDFLSPITKSVHGALKGISGLAAPVLSPVFGAAQGITDIIDPVASAITRNVPVLKDVHQFIKNNPLDAAALAAATALTAGAAGAGGLGAAGASAGAGAGASAGTSALSAAITPTFSSAAVPAATSATGATMASSITPAMSSLVTPAATSGGLGTLGAAGLQAANSALTPSLASLGAKAATPTLLQSLGGALKQGNDLYSTFSKAQGLLGDSKPQGGSPYTVQNPYYASPQERENAQQPRARYYDLLGRPVY